MSYGTSIKLNDAEDFSFDPTTNKLSLVTGIDNMAQGIRILLKTGLGEIKTFPNFGIDMPQLLDRNISQDNIKHAISNALIRDTRVASIDDIKLNKVGRTLYATIKLTANDKGKLEFTVSTSW